MDSSGVEPDPPALQAGASTELAYCPKMGLTRFELALSRLKVVCIAVLLQTHDDSCGDRTHISALKGPRTDLLF